MAKYKVGNLVYIPYEKTKGKIVNILKGKEKTHYLIEIITSFNKETGERTTRLTSKSEDQIRPYKKANKVKKVKRYNPNEMYYMVREFHKAFGHKYNDKPTPMDEETALNRAVWTTEELVELLYATVGGDKDKFLSLIDQFLQGIDKNVNKILKENKPVDDILVAQADALTDVEYFNQGSFTILGVKPFNLFKIVQEANMAKLFPDGKPRYRESDGKIIKPDGWEENYAPEKRLKAEIARQKRISK
jgi:predicted HAD superfamily Cof-like phosphohydrolase